MPRKVPPPRIVSVTPSDRPLGLQIRWNTGDDTPIDVSGLVNAFRLYAPLRDNPELFRRVWVGEHGADLVWPGDLDIEPKRPGAGFRRRLKRAPIHRAPSCAAS
jgi:hypothetical protein